MPSTRARTWAVRTAWIRPGTSTMFSTAWARATTMPTSGGGGAPAGCLLHAPRRIRPATARETRSRVILVHYPGKQASTPEQRRRLREPAALINEDNANRAAGLTAGWVLARAKYSGDSNAIQQRHSGRRRDRVGS